MIDFVGNHASFLHRLRTLVSLGPGPDGSSLERYLKTGAPPPMPAGCAIDVEPEAIDLVRLLLPRGGSEVTCPPMR